MDKFSIETKDILIRINKLENLETKDYEFEWNLEEGLRYISADFLIICIDLLEKCEMKLEKQHTDKYERIKITNNIINLCNYDYTDENLKEVIKSNKILGDENIFNPSFGYHNNFVCHRCNYSKCPKFYAGYLLYLKNKGLLEEKLKDREEFRRNTFESDYFTFSWNLEDGLKNVPEKTFNNAMLLLDNKMVDVEQKLKKDNLVINLAVSCSEYSMNSDNFNEFVEKKKSQNFDWRYVTRNLKELLYNCNSWDCAKAYCLYDVAGYLFYLKKTGNWKQVEEDRKYYAEHKEEIEEKCIKKQEEHLNKIEKELREKRETEIQNVLKYKERNSNIEQIIDKIFNERGLHITIEGARGTGKFDLANKICSLLYASKKVNNKEPEYLSLYSLAQIQTTAGVNNTINEMDLNEKNLYVLTDIKEFINNFKKEIEPSNNYIEIRRQYRIIELITSIFNENYIIIVSDKKSVDELLTLDPKLKFVYQNNRYEIPNLPIDELFDTYCKNLNNKLQIKINNDDSLKEKVKEDFIEYISINAEFAPFCNEELAKYLANYSIGKKDYVFPENIYKKETDEESLKNIIGLKTVKDNIKKFEKYALYTVKAKNLGLKANKSNLHMIFTGNPGTGKTTVARIMAKMLYDLGLISENKLVEVERKDLVSEYIGQTASKTSEVISKAMGGVLFIDEAYSLAPSRDVGRDFGLEAIATLIKAMEDYKDNLVVIFAGYKDEMKTFLDINPGIASRIGYTFNFEDYSKEELSKMFFLKMTNMGYLVDEKVEIDILKLFDYYTKRKNFGNGRFVDKLIQEVIMKHALRDTKNINKITVEDIPTIENLNNTNYSDNESKDMFDNLVGMQDLKDKIKEFEKYMKFLKRVEGENISIPEQNLHMIFTGNPGTGKTTVARIIAKMLFDMGIIHENKLVEVERKDLIAGYVGQTAIKTNEVIEKALGGVLFIDEAYSLAQGHGSNYDFGAEAIATLIKAMEDHKGEFVVIFAGYKKEMKDFLDINPGIASRVGYTFDFPDYSASEYCEIYYRKISSLGFTIDEKAKVNVEEVMKYFCNVENIGNGRFVDKVVQNTLLKLANKKDDITVIAKDNIPTINEMIKTMFAGENMIDPRHIDKASQKRTAIHEIGHAMVRYLLNKTPGIKKITINAEGAGTLGYVEGKIDNIKYTHSKKEYLDRICVLLGGMCNEAIYLGEYESGNGSDLRKASEIVRDMITKYGMSSLGLYTLSEQAYADRYVFEEANKILSECYDRTLKLLEQNKDRTKNAIEYLLINKEIDEDEFLKSIKK